MSFDLDCNPSWKEDKVNERKKYKEEEIFCLKMDVDRLGVDKSLQHRRG